MEVMEQMGALHMLKEFAERFIFLRHETQMLNTVNIFVEHRHEDARRNRHRRPARPANEKSNRSIDQRNRRQGCV